MYLLHVLLQKFLCNIPYNRKNMTCSMSYIMSNVNRPSRPDTTYVKTRNTAKPCTPSSPKDTKRPTSARVEADAETKEPVNTQTREEVK